MAQAITSSCVYKEIVPGIGGRMLYIETPNTTDTGDTILITLSQYGASAIGYIHGMVETTEGSVVVAEAPTCAVSGGVLTITVGGSTVSDKRRNYLIGLR